MKTNFFALTIYLMALCSGLSAETNAADWGPATGNIQMSIRLIHGGNEIRTNEPIELTIRIKNLSPVKPVTFKKWVGVDVFETNSSTPVLSRAENEPASYVSKDGWGSGSAKLAKVPANSVYECKINIGRLNDHTSRGVYKVVLKRATDQGMIVTANPLYLKVVPGKLDESNAGVVLP